MLDRLLCTSVYVKMRVESLQLWFLIIRGAGNTLNFTSSNQDFSVGLHSAFIKFKGTLPELQVAKKRAHHGVELSKIPHVAGGELVAAVSPRVLMMDNRIYQS